MTAQERSTPLVLLGLSLTQLHRLLAIAPAGTLWQEIENELRRREGRDD
jgi:hypothetical protein